ncbi:nitroreductase family protein [Oerskovia enterophila]|uniref:5,6-dimethylbenzimidazole synthase n=1 Tax=Oerskovia enterophila TaxID=43678 RepID=A0A163QL96_9CELL|nr:nitroreductase family protein [Oerskovia enterophila]KZM34286.1 5,6-dimethylbenzimidazole synthase [Oerskovia enterophila]
MTASEELSILRALHTTPARRYLSADPVPDDVLDAILDAAIRGPSGGNRQQWAWIVVTDPAVKAQIAEWYREGWSTAYGRRRDDVLAAATDGTGVSPATYRAIEHLALHLEEAPVWVLPVLRNAAGSTDPRLGASIYGAVQNLVLAARAYGIGATLTSFYAAREADVAALLGLPTDAATMGLVPLGYPERGRWSEPRRRPLSEVVHRDRWRG